MIGDIFVQQEDEEGQIDSVNYLGVVFDRKLLWIDNIESWISKTRREHTPTGNVLV